MQYGCRRDRGRGSPIGIGPGILLCPGPRSVVSHWEVDSAATVKLVTGAIKRLASDPAIGRAEAMRQSMSDMIENGKASEAHPAYWAPFVVVGEGGSVK